jgi:hypothetical protein
MQELNISTTDNNLGVEKREMITMYVAFLHESFFDPNKKISHQVADEYKNEPFPVKLKALINIATNFAKSLGASEQDIHDTVFIPSVRCTYNRLLAAV